MKSEAEVRAWAGQLARKAMANHHAQIAATTPAQAREMLCAVIKRMPEPEDLTDQDMVDYGDIGFVAEWIDAQQKKRAVAAHQMQGVSIALVTLTVLIWYGVIATGTRGPWLGVAIAMSVMAFVACAAVLVQAWRAK